MLLLNVKLIIRVRANYFNAFKHETSVSKVHIPLINDVSTLIKTWQFMALAWAALATDLNCHKKLSTMMLALVFKNEQFSVQKNTSSVGAVWNAHCNEL